MRWVTFAAGGAERVGALIDGEIHVVAAPSLLSLLGDDGERLAVARDEAQRDPRDVLQAGSVRLLAPIPQPPTVRDFYAFEQHVKTARSRRGLEMIPEWYEIPVFYFSNPYAVNGDGAEVSAPPGSTELDFELEVAAVVGRSGSNLSADTAERYVAGYCVMNDWSARDLQRTEMKLNMGPVKGKDFATTLGPALVTPDEIEHARKGKAFDLAMTARVNGTEYSRASWSDVNYSIGEMLAYASRGTRIEPGDVIGTGTCGTGCILELSLVHGAAAYPWLQPGDDVELEIEGLGVLHNRVGTPR